MRGALDEGPRSCFTLTYYVTALSLLGGFKQNLIFYKLTYNSLYDNQRNSMTRSYFFNLICLNVWKKSLRRVNSMFPKFLSAAKRTSVASSSILVGDCTPLPFFKRSTLFAFLPSWNVANTVSYYEQFTGAFLPELFLTITLTAVLALLAVDIGEAHTKRRLALYSLEALSKTLLYVAVLYCLQLVTGDFGALFNGYLTSSAYTVVLKLITLLSGYFILVSSEAYLRRHTQHLLEYPTVLVLAILFMLLLVGSSHFVSAFLTLVGFSLNLYVLILFDAGSGVAREAGIKYFYLSTVSSGLILFSTFLIFLVANTGHFSGVNIALSSSKELLTSSADLLQFALVFLFIGLFFKLSAFPGHLWAAEVYEGSPDPIMAFFMLPVKIAILAFTLQVTAVAFDCVPALWQPLLTLGAIFSLLWGCFAAFAEKKTKRFLAYASINQIGFLLLGVSSASMEGYRTTLFYLLVYALMNVAFLVVFLHTRLREYNTGLLYLTDFRDIGVRYRTHFSWPLAMALFSMAGIPPLAGFFGKYYLLLHAQAQGLYALVIVGLITSLVSTYYYLRIIKIIWFDKVHSRHNLSSCAASVAVYRVLRVVEWSLWLFFVYAGVFIYLSETLLETLVTGESFFVACVAASHALRASK